MLLEKVEKLFVYTFTLSVFVVVAAVVVKLLLLLLSVVLSPSKCTLLEKINTSNSQTTEKKLKKDES